MLLAQVSDCHIGLAAGETADANRARLRAVLARLAAAPRRPDALLLSGDLTEQGDAASYAGLAADLAACPFPVWPMMGNHDRREGLLAAFPQVRPGQGFVQYEVALAGLRLIVLDTTQPGRHGGAFCADRARWLAARLDADRSGPVLIALHHPPRPLGIGWMDCAGGEPWIARLAAVLRGRGQVRALLCGHVHRAAATAWRGFPLLACPSSAPAIVPDLCPLDLDAPDGRALVVAEPPGYALHHWDGSALVSHFAMADDGPPVLRFDARGQEILRRIRD